MEQNFCDYLLDNNDINRVTHNMVYVGDERIGRKTFITDYMKVKDLEAAGCLEVADWTNKDKSTFFKTVLDTLSLYFKDAARERFMSKDIPEMSIPREQLIPVLDVRTDEVLLYNTNVNQISEVNFKAWERKLTKDERASLNTLMRDALLIYDPYNLDTFVPLKWEGMEVLKVNTYNAPKWRLEKEPENDDCPEQIWKVLLHLFPTDDCLEFILNWLYIALVGRNETYLVLNGRKGIGKGVFCELICALVGREHFSDAPSSLLSGQFNSVLDKKRVILMDEFRVGKSEHNKLKRFINKYQNIEKKGIDADKSKEIYNSYIISNNDVTDMYLEPDDRRFSVPDVSEDLLTKVLSKKEIDNLLKDIEKDEDLIKQFGYFIYNHGKSKKYHEFSAYMGPHFWKISHASLKEWQKFIVYKIFSREEEEYGLKSLGKEFGKERTNQFAGFPRNYEKIGDFLKNYLHNGTERLGTVEKVEGEYLIIPLEKYWPEDSETEDDLL